MSASSATFRRDFEQACADYGLSAASRAMAWKAAWHSGVPLRRAARIYAFLAHTRTLTRHATKEKP